MSANVPNGFRVSGVHCGIKQASLDNDLALIVSDRPAVAAGVYTQNRVFAAPVAWDRSRTPSDFVRAIVANAGNANACTGTRGDDDNRAMALRAGEACGVDGESVLVLSTGIIGEFLPMENIAKGIAAAKEKLSDDSDSLISVAKAILTTDTKHKLVSRTLRLGGRDVQVAALAKGAGMIGPNMATMLGVILTDAKLDARNAQDVLTSVTDSTFNCVSVDGHTSTNDTILMLANGAAGGEPLTGPDLESFHNALLEICTELARAIASDGEGANHLITIEVAGCATSSDATKVARAVANSPLVKTAVAGADPNWGRIVSAAGYAGVAFDPGKVDLTINGELLYEHGAPVEFNAEAVSASMRDNHETRIDLQFGEGDAKARFWSCDLTVDYVKINAEYHT